MTALTVVQQNVLRFLHASPAPITAGCYRGALCAEARPGTDRRVWLPLAVYDRLIERDLTVRLGPNDTRRRPNYAHPQVARLLGVPLREAVR